MKLKLVAFLVSIMACMTGCGTVGESLNSAFNMTTCEYDYKSISNLSLAGMDMSKGVSPMHIPRIAAIVGGKSSSIPMNFTLNLDVKNRNTTAAALSGMQYIINIDGIELTTGSFNQMLNIAGGTTQVLPLSVGVDLATLVKKNSASAVENMVKNFIGIGSQKSNVKLQLKPSFMIGSQSIASPVYIPVSFSFGGN
ncbi:MAG: hypothetical protein RL662_1876 [Bacteroidota bacterium]|jgi:LEA14-like dessication related protein